MRLILTSDSPINTIYTEESGAAQYKVKTTFKVHNRPTVVSRVVEGIPHGHSGSADGDEREAEDGVRFANLANIDWRASDATVITFRGQEFVARDFFRKGKLGLNGHDRIFTALDGREFRWSRGSLASELILNDATEAVIASYRRKTLLDMFSKPSKAAIEVLPAFEDMLDEIMVTFVYMERLREMDERGL